MCHKLPKFWWIQKHAASLKHSDTTFGRIIILVSEISLNNGDSDKNLIVVVSFMGEAYDRESITSRQMTIDSYYLFTGLTFKGIKVQGVKGLVIGANHYLVQYH